MSKKILIIDDSALMRRVISDIINQNNDFEVDAIARDGLEGFDLIVSNPNRYSAIILDINMPKMNGLELLEKLQKNHINQIVIVVSTVAKEGAKETIKALELGAFDFVTKPENYLETKGEIFKNKLYDMLRIATSSRVSMQGTKQSSSASRMQTSSKQVSTLISTKSDKSIRPTGEVSGTKNSDVLIELRKRNAVMNQNAVDVDSRFYTGIKQGKKKIVALACSTGGPKSLQQVIPMLPKNLDAAVVIVQHMPKGFTLSLAQRLNEISKVEVKEAEEGDIVTKGCVYIAPGGMHMRIEKSGNLNVIRLSEEPAIDGLRPCANVMYHSLEKCDYDEIICVVLTGMGADGTKGIQGLASVKKNIHVISQNEETCVVYGMPRAIAQAGLVDEVVSLNEVAATITKNVGVS